MKDGKKHEGKILEETPETLIIEVFITKSIKDRLTLKREEISEVTKISKKQLALEKLQNQFPIPDLYSVKDYELFESRTIGAYLKEFPLDFNLSEIKKLKKTINSEKERATKGDQKIQGQWYTSEEYAQNQFELDAQIEGAKILNAMKQNGGISLLRRFENFQKNFQNTQSYANVHEAIKPTIVAHLKRLDQNVKTIEQRKEQRKTSYERLSAYDQDRVSKKREEDQKRLTEILKKETKLKSHWKSFDPFDTASLTNARKAAFAGYQAYKKAGPSSATAAPLVQEVFKDAVSAAQDGHILETETLIKEIKKSGIPTQYHDVIKEHLDKALAESNRSPK